MLTEVATSRYVVKVNGVVKSSPLPTYHIAEAMILTLPIDQQASAVIVILAESGGELLLG